MQSCFSSYIYATVSLFVLCKALHYEFIKSFCKFLQTKIFFVTSCYCFCCGFLQELVLYIMLTFFGKCYQIFSSYFYATVSLSVFWKALRFKFIRTFCKCKQKFSRTIVLCATISVVTFCKALHGKFINIFLNASKALLRSFILLFLMRHSAKQCVIYWIESFLEMQTKLCFVHSCYCFCCDFLQGPAWYVH